MAELVSDKSLCCGCSACYDICLKSAITMVEDNEGFLYPVIDKDKCVECGLCEKICPAKNLKNNQSLLEAYATYNTNENIRMKSSSGGIFTLLAEEVLNNNGIVYGAAFDKNFEVQHIRVETVEELECLRGSKYVQSKLDGIYILCKKDLEMGKQVLFTGTPCQVSALKNFLRKDYANLVCMDIVCHGVPSRMVWRKYLEYRVNFAKSKIAQIAFRLKNEGWKQYAVKFTFANSTAYCKKFTNDTFMRGFLKNLYLRPSCYNCNFKTKERISDITVADFWGIDKLHPELDDNKGMTLLIVHTTYGNNLLDNIRKNIFLQKVTLDDAVKYNSAMVKSVSKHINRERFFSTISNQKNISSYIESHLKIRLIDKVKREIRRFFKK